VENIVENFLLFEGWRAAGIVQGGLDLPYNIAYIGQVFNTPFSGYYIEAMTLYIPKIGEVPDSKFRVQ
jgi:hypothetical protein